MKAYRILFASLFAGALMVSCNKEAEQETITDAPATAKEYTLTIEASKAVGSKALALSPDGKSLQGTWAEGDEVAVCKLTGDASNPISQVVGKLVPQTIGSASTKLTGTVTLEGLAVNDWLYLQFPYKVNSDNYIISSYQGQDGTLGTIAKDFDYATCGVQVTAVDATNLSTTKADFVGRQAIVKFSLKSGGAALNASKLYINGVADRFWHDSYYDEPLLEVAAASPSNEFTVAMHGLGEASYTMFAVSSDKVYTRTTPAVDFADNQYHQGGLSMTALSYEGFGTNSSWSLIGKLSEYSMNWDNDLNMWTDGSGVHVAASVKLKAGDEFKFRKDGAWDVNYGSGAIAGTPAVVPAYSNGPNISVAADGTYDIYLDERGFIAIVPASGAGKEYTLYVLEEKICKTASWGTERTLYMEAPMAEASVKPALTVGGYTYNGFKLDDSLAGTDAVVYYKGENGCEVKMTVPVVAGTYDYFIRTDGIQAAKITDSASPEELDSTPRVYVRSSAAALNCHMWGGASQTTWPGASLSRTDSKQWGHYWFYADILSGSTSFIINDGTAQTGDQLFSNYASDNGSYYFYWYPDQATPSLEYPTI